MSPGAIEEGVKTVGQVVTALSSTPMTIAMILTNVMLIVFLFYSQNQFYLQRQEVTKMIVEQQREVQVLLSKCVVPDQRTKFRIPLRVPGPATELKVDPPKPAPLPDPPKVPLE